MTVATRPADRADLDQIVAFIRELAVYEKLEEAVRATPADVAALLFGASPVAFCDIAEVEGEPVGFAVWFYNVSTFLGRKGIYLEDLYIREADRGKGAGLALLKGLARRCRAEGLGRLEWAVLNWNAPAIAFYDQLGAEAMDGWTVRRMTGDALEKLAR
ncbi:MAG: family N-acetyltransferase [Caulobacteraceae bacterium]|nr:family N-acetyltransferase [Caulobacteraceae bacterium]